jgi:predicted small secreted protein
MHKKTMIVVLAAACAAVLGCENTAQGIKEDAKENEAKVREEANSAEAQEAKRDAEAAAREAGAELKEAAGKAGDALAGAAAELAPAVDAKKQTLDVKTALMADSTIDATRIDVDTDAATKTVTLKGTVATASQKSAAERIAKSKAAGYTVKNMLVVARS